MWMCGRDYAGRLSAAHNQARRLAAGPVSEPGDKRVVEVGAPPPLNTQSGGCRRIRTSFGGSSGPPPARVRAGYRPYPGRRVGGGEGPGRIRPSSGPKGGVREVRWRLRGPMAPEGSDGAGGGPVAAGGCGGACRGGPVGLPARDWRGLGEGQARVRRGSGEGPAGA